MPTRHIAKLYRIGHKIFAGIWFYGEDVDTYKIFYSERLMKKYARKNGLFLEKEYYKPKFFLNEIELKII